MRSVTRASREVSVAGSSSISSWRRRPPLVALGELGDQAVDAVGADLLREAVAVVLDQPDAEHVDVVDLPAVAGLLEPVVELDRIALAADLGAHDDLVVGRRRAHRLQLDRLLRAHLRQRAGVRADEQQLELVLQALLLIGRRLLPVAADRRCRHALEVDVGQHLLVDQRDDLPDVAGLDRLVGLDGVENVGRDVLDERVGRLRALRLGADAAATEERRSGEPGESFV